MRMLRFRKVLSVNSSKRKDRKTNRGRPRAIRGNEARPSLQGAGSWAEHLRVGQT